VLILHDDMRARLESLVRAGYPHETCGLLLGTREGPDGARSRVERVEVARNLRIERAHDRYELDPADFLRIDEVARAAGLEVLGVWHSHPDHPARPSETDRAAAWEGWSYVIVSVAADGVRDLRSWRLEGEAFREEEVAAPAAAPARRGQSEERMR
jgi:proteasome lid subunit RPN8/RPN11